MSTTDAAETERHIREKLEASGQFGKMRAMIVEAALQTLNGPQEGLSSLFTASPALLAAKKDVQGPTALGLVVDFLETMGLQYTASVLRMEADLAADSALPRGELVEALSLQGGAPSAEACLLTLLRRPASGVPTAATAAVPAEAAPSGSDHEDDSSEKEEEKEEEEEEEEEEASDSATSDHNQPGGQDTTYYISKWKKRHFVRHNQVTGQQVQLEYLTDCSVVVLDPLDSMTVDDCEGGELIIAACEGSVFLRNCKNMTVHVACKQLRTRDCENVGLHIFTTTDPVVEMSHHMTFVPFHLRLPGLTEAFQQTRLDPKTNRFVHVYDFTVDEKSLPQPHFTVQYPEHGQVMEDRCATYGAVSCPPEIEELLELRLMPASSSESGQNKSYDIKTGGKIWTGTAAASVAPVPVVTGGAPAVSKVESYEDEAEDFDEDSSSSEEDAVEDEDPSKKRPPLAQKAAPVPVPTATLHATTHGGLDDQDYSSFSEDVESEDIDDKYEVDEDDDDF